MPSKGWTKTQDSVAARTQQRRLASDEAWSLSSDNGKVDSEVTHRCSYQAGIKQPDKPSLYRQLRSGVCRGMHDDCGAAYAHHTCMYLQQGCISAAS